MDGLRLEWRAQTNTQLYGQLLAAGYGRDEIVAVHQAYLLAVRVFAAQLRPEGRPFVCHVVGVASILAIVRAPHSTVVAGLLHSAYSHGDFGYGRGRVPRAARDWLRAAAGSAVEQLVDCYAGHPWNTSTVRSLLAKVNGPDPQLRQIALIRLADTLDDALDHGFRMSEKASNPNRPLSVERLVDLANAVGHPELAASLRQLMEDAKDVPATLAALRDPHAGSYLVCPSSWSERFRPRIARLLRRVRAGH